MVYLKEMTCHNQVEAMKIYEESFLPEERKLFTMLTNRRDKKKAELYVIIEEQTDRIVGIAFFFVYKKDVLFDYFALLPEFRNKGYGTEVIELIKKIYEGKRIFGEVEVPDDKSDTYKNQQRRMEFYTRCGLKRTGIIVDMNGIELEIMYIGDTPITYNYYKTFLRKVFGLKYSFYASSIFLKN